MYIEKVPNRNSKPTYLLRTAWREGKKTRKKTLANLSGLSLEQIEMLRRILKNEKLVSPDVAFEVVSSYHHGHVQAVLLAMKKLKFVDLVASKHSRNRALVIGMIIARILNPSSKLAITRWMQDTTLPLEIPEIADIKEDDLYKAMDWLIKQKPYIEKKLSNRHLKGDKLVLYDLSSSYVEGECCNLAKYGYSRDSKKGKRQINYGLLTNKKGCPIAIDIFPGNTTDSTTLFDQVQKLKAKFQLEQIALVGDRGMITQGHIDQFKTMKNIDWITALKHQQIRVVFDDKKETIEKNEARSLFEMTHPNYPGERLIVCRNEKLLEKRRHNRQSLITKTEEKLQAIQNTIENKNISGQDEIGLRVGKVINKFKVGKLFKLHIKDVGFTYSIDQEKLSQETRLDGIYVIRTGLSKKEMSGSEAVISYKQLCNVERAFRSLKTVDLKIRPIYHYADDRVKAHIVLCMLAYYVAWHMKESWRELLFSDEEIDAKLIRDPIKPSEPSENAKAKAKTKKLKDGSQAHSFQSLLHHLSTIVKNKCRYRASTGRTDYFMLDTLPNKKQKRAFDLLQTNLFPAT